MCAKSFEIFLALLKLKQTMGFQVQHLSAFVEVNSRLVL